MFFQGTLGLLVAKEGNQCPYQKFFGKMPHWISNMHSYGEVGVVNKGIEIISKDEYKGFVAVFVGYCAEHSQDTYRMFNLKTERLCTTRDVRWLNMLYGEYMSRARKKELAPEDQDVDSDSESSDDSLLEVQMVPKTETGREQEAGRAEVVPSSRLTRELPHLPRQKFPAVIRSKRDKDKEMGDILSRLETLESSVKSSFVLAAASLQYSWVEPKDYKEMKTRPMDEQKKWQEGMKKEFTDFHNRKVWEFVPKREVPDGRKILGSKWVYKKKRSGIYRSRLVAKGYNQIPGVDFTESFAPVVSDATMRIVLTMMLVFKWDYRVLDVETAFLEGKLEEEIFMEIPEGLEEYFGLPEGVSKETHVLRLNSSMYGLIQAARCFFKELSGYLINQCNFIKSEADQCLLYKRSDLGVSVILVYVDDDGCFGDRAALDDAERAIKARFSIKRVDNLEDYLGCKITVQEKSDGTRRAWVTQPDILAKLYKKYNDEIGDRNYSTPGTPGFVVVRSKEEDAGVMLDKESQSDYRSGVGTLLYLLKHSRPELSNCVRELTKVLDGAKLRDQKEMFRVIRFVLNTVNLGLKLDPKLEFDEDGNLILYLEGISDSAWASDLDNRRSITGYILYFMGCPIIWKSKAQVGVTQSSTECEYVSLSELVKDIMFVVQVLESMGYEVRYPIVCKCDNLGAIFLSNSNCSTTRTKHVDIRYHYFKEFIERGVLKIIFVKSEDNDSDIMTKNLPVGPYETHVEKLVSEVPN